MPSIWEILTSLGPWNWLVLAVVLFILETILPGVHFVWFGVAASIVGVLALTIGVSWPWQLALFGAIALASVLLFRRYANPSATPSDQPGLNMRGSYYIGRIVTVEEAIVSGRGRARVGDSLWSVEGPDVPAGTQVKVVGANGTVLVVEEIS
jgi:membrane protein implicated in regulation of membrane protease activity